MEKWQAEVQRRQCWNAVTTARRVWFSFNAIKNHIKVGGCLKEPLNNLDEFWQRQVFKLEALGFKHSHSMVQTNNEEIGSLAKPLRVSL